ncbi:MAG: acetyltransferase [Ferruginibacter sp.]|nr:acetyltransferase [Ferruginibacter sp.]
MQEIVTTFNEKGSGAFYVKEGEERLAEMIVEVKGKVLTAFHTEVFAAESKGMGKSLLNAMVTYARQHQLKVVPLCLFVHAQFKRHPELYADIWQKDND